jgi:crotonobetainyl-CoA:carnitine CoA-transferase CaiB-like acyl-CoA transferase
MHAHPQIGARKLVTEFEHPRARQVKTIPVSGKFSPTVGESGWAAEIAVPMDECLMTMAAGAAGAGNP